MWMFSKGDDTTILKFTIISPLLKGGARTTTTYKFLRNCRPFVDVDFAGISEQGLFSSRLPHLFRNFVTSNRKTIREDMETLIMLIHIHTYTCIYTTYGKTWPSTTN